MQLGDTALGSPAACASGWDAASTQGCSRGVHFKGTRVLHFVGSGC